MNLALPFPMLFMRPEVVDRGYNFEPFEKDYDPETQTMSASTITMAKGDTWSSVTSTTSGGNWLLPSNNDDDPDNSEDD